MADNKIAQSGAAADVLVSRRRRWMLGIGLGVSALLVLALLILVLLDPAATRMRFGILLQPLTANTKPPAIFADQLAGPRVPDRAETSRQLTARLQQEFPLGTTEAALEAALLAQGFKPPDPPPQHCIQPVQHGVPLRSGQADEVGPPPNQGKRLKYEWGGGVCSQTIWISWKTDARDVVTLLDGYYSPACL